MAKVINQKEFKKLQRNLKRLPERIRRNVVNGSVRAAGVVVLKEVKNNAPEDEGELKKAIYIKKRRGKKTTVVYSVSIKKTEMKLSKNRLKNTRQYGYYKEYGTKYMKATPFIRPALSSVGQRPVTAARAYFKKRLPKELAKKR